MASKRKVIAGPTGLTRPGPWAVPVLSLLLFSTGCDSLTVHSFAGAILELTLEGAKVTPAGQHLEVWGRDNRENLIRLQPLYDTQNYHSAPGLIIRQAISPTDPCMTDGHGHLLTTADAYPTTVSYAGVPQTPDEQAQQRVTRIKQLNPSGMAPLLAVLPWDSHSEPPVIPTASPSDRQAACDQYEAAGDNTYVPNPDQINAPLHGNLYGFVGFTSLTPPTTYDGIRLDVAVNLAGLQEVFMTLEGDTVDPNHRGPLYLTSQAQRGGREVLQFRLVPEAPDGPTGGLAVYTDLDQDPVQF